MAILQQNNLVNGHHYLHICEQTIVEQTPEGPTLALCGVPIPAKTFSARQPQNRVNRCRRHLRSR